MTIYIFRGEHKNKSEELLKKAVKMYAAAHLQGFDTADLLIERTEKGKPYIKDAPFHFSISHTENLWGCLISSHEVGLDIQVKRNVNFEKIANRFFVSEEVEFVRHNGIDGFFDIWVRKEAVIKYLGTGLRDIRSFCTVKNGKLTDEINYKNSTCYLGSVEIASGVKGAYCLGEVGLDLWIIELN